MLFCKSIMRRYYFTGCLNLTYQFHWTYADLNFTQAKGVDQNCSLILSKILIT